MKQALSPKNIWERTPQPIKTVLGSIMAIAPTSIVLGRNFRKNLRFARKAQWWSAERTHEYQLTQIRRICTQAYNNTTYYHRLFDYVGFDLRDLKSVEDLGALPVIDKDTLLAHLEEMCTVHPYGASIDYVSTGGTGGAPLHFYIGADRSAIEYAYLVAGWERVGYRLNVLQAVLRGQVVHKSRNGLYHEYDPILRRHYYSNFHMTDANIKRYMEHIATLGPCFLLVYPSSAATLATFLERSRVAAPANIQGVLAGSENVYQDQREMVEKAFGRRFFSWYGHTEKLVLAAECEYSTDYHVWPSYGYFELLDEQDNPVTTPGQTGEIVGTGFINKVVPFIRYRTGDHAIYVGDHCEMCGRECPVIREIRGHRTQEMLVTKDGSAVSWTSLNMHDDTFLRVRQFQFVQHQPGSAKLSLVPAEGFNGQDQRRILEHLSKKLDGQLKVNIELTDSIRLSSRGKTIYVDQRISPYDRVPS